LFGEFIGCSMADNSEPARGAPNCLLVAEIGRIWTWHCTTTPSTSTTRRAGRGFSASTGMVAAFAG
jgi:hypothetical protein